MPVVFTSTLGFDSLGQEISTFSHFGELVYAISQASQAWMDHQVWEEKGNLKFSWDVVADLFPEGLIDSMFEAYCCFLKQLATSETSWQETDRQLIPTDQLVQRQAINATTAPIPDGLLHTLFAAQCQKHGSKVAVVSAQRTLTYQELYEQSNQVGHRLRRLGVIPNQLVAVVMNKGWEQVVAVMGILASGAAYAPIDPELPQERLLYLLKDSDVNLVLTQSDVDEKLFWPKGIQRLCVDGSDLNEESKAPLALVQTPDDLAYVIYTSGSTGLPKGVAIAHRGVVNAIVQTNQYFDIGSDDRILGLTALSHDLSVYDIFGILAAGGTLVIPDAAARKDPAHWIELMQQEKITLWNSVPAMMEMMLDTIGDRAELLPHSWRWAFLGGDWISTTLPDRLHSLAPHVRIVSVGGPTETTLWNIWYPVERVNPAWKSIPYGKPIANTQYYVLNASLNDCPTWVPGELYCAGVGLAKGYWRNEEKTRTRFITHPRTGERIYRTGDRGRYWPDGAIEFLGRVDFQIKLRGHRIEVKEVEAAFRQHPNVRSVVVSTIGQSHPQDRLAAYVVPNKISEITIEELRNFLKSKLPEYMIPHRFLFLEALPLSANGKVNRLALPTPDLSRPNISSNLVAPRTSVEQVIATVWAEVLETESIGVHDNFFDLGGDSLLATKAIARIRQVFQADLSVRHLFEKPTVAELADLLLHNPAQRQTVEKTAQLMLMLADMSEDEADAMLNQYPLSTETGGLR